MGRLFGTDGVRGKANEALTAELALSLSVAQARVLGETGEFHGHTPFAVVGRDPRASGEFLEAAVVAGLASAGVNVVRLGVLPTRSRVPHRGLRRRSRRHAVGQSQPDARQRHQVLCARRQQAGRCARGRHRISVVGVASADWRWRWPGDGPRSRWSRRTWHTWSTASGAPSVWRASGSSSTVRTGLPIGAAAAFGALGAEVHRIHAEPDGININENCGSTHMDSLRSAVLKQRADIGIALDGDADRCLAVDTFGRIVDGDQILAILALAPQRGRLANDTVVATVMSNLGFVNAMRGAGVAVQQTKVGDRYVLEAMKAGDFVLGGAVRSRRDVGARHHRRRHPHRAPSDEPDGEVGSIPGQLASVMTRLPQVLINVPDVDKSRAATDPQLTAAVAEAQAELGDSAGSFCARPARSRWSASWWRRRVTRRPTKWRIVSRTWSRPLAL